MVSSNSFSIKEFPHQTELFVLGFCLLLEVSLVNSQVFVNQLDVKIVVSVLESVRDQLGLMTELQLELLLDLLDFFQLVPRDATEATLLEVSVVVIDEW